MSIGRKASLLFLISTLLFLTLSVALGLNTGLSEDAVYLLNSLAVSVPAFLIPAVIFRRRQHFPVFKFPRISYLLIAIVIGIGCVMLDNALSCLTEIVFYGVRVESLSTTSASILALDPVNMIVSLAILPPLCEEFIMRGTLLESWRRYSPIGAAVLTSLLFGLLHGAPSSLLVYFGIGMVMAMVYLITRSVWLSVVVHLVVNLSSVLSAILMRQELGLGAADAAEQAGAMTEMELSVPAYFQYLLQYALLAGVILVPMMLLLRALCRRRGDGMYACGYDSLDDGRVFVTSYELEEGAAQGAKGHGLLADPFLWAALALLIVLNTVTGLIEFGVLKAD